ncbi:MAG: 50S ribosomal protein L32 [Oscillospiraceae bacterium]|jgi:large subunit ribosomal protein L32|nr:50S ribosomal protein L32 [Oscillospiraceae bacterium]
MAVPKRKVSKARRDSRRSSVQKLQPLNFAKCAECGALMIPHRVCKTCGKYNGRQILDMSIED